MLFRFSRRAFLERAALGGAAWGTGLLAPAGAAVPTAPAARRTNLLFIFSDQQSWDMLGGVTKPQLITPNLDAFAATGVRFNHCVSSSPLCTPFRGLLLSGRHPLRSGAVENDVRMLPGDGKYFAQVLRDAGYRTGYYGKWHLYGGDRVRPIPAGPDRYGFDNEFLTNNCTVIYDAKRAYYWDEAGRKTLYGDWEPYAQTRQALEFIDKHGAEPFACFLSWHAPHNWDGGHAGYNAPEDCLALYDPAKVKLRPNVEDTPDVRMKYQGHMALISSIDRAFGWLMDKLSQKGLADNTVVVFTSDHGDCLLSHGVAHNKMRPEQESIRVPLMIRAPGQLRARVSGLLVGTLDLMPTILGLLGLEVPAECEGRNLARAIAEGDDDAVESVPLFLLPLDWRGIYTRRYTYAFDVNTGQPSLYRQMFFNRDGGFAWNVLYDHERDPGEVQNLYYDYESRELRKRLHEQALAWMNRFGDLGATRDALIEACARPGEAEAWRRAQWKQCSGTLAGRPADMLRKDQKR
jgi:arylsulfatase A-like enzyme